MFDRFGDIKEGEAWWADKAELKAAFDTLDADKRDVSPSTERAKDALRKCFNSSLVSVSLISVVCHRSQVLSRVGERIRKFAKAQRSSVTDTECDIPGGTFL